MPPSASSEKPATALKKLPPGFPKYKHLPPGWEDVDRYWFYGWAVTHEHLRDYLVKHYDPATVPKDLVVATLTALDDLRSRSGFDDICLVGGLPDEQAIAQGPVISAQCFQVDVIAIGCTRSAFLYHRRPLPEQLAKLVELLGEQPRWFKDCNAKAHFEDELMCCYY